MVLLSLLAFPEAPRLVTEQTRANAAALARLQRPGTALFRDDFETPASLGQYFEIRRDNGDAEIDPRDPYRGRAALRLTARNHNGQAAGANLAYWFGDRGPYDRIHIRSAIKFASGYDQGDMNHTGLNLTGLAGTNKWRGMGTAGLRPRGDDYFNTSLEATRDWQRVPSPGYLFAYTYWMEMTRDRDGNFWGNVLGPEPSARIVPPRGKWVVLELMIQNNTVGRADGELAVWVDGRLYSHHVGIRWRSDPAVTLKRAGLQVYVHRNTRDNTTWFDDFVVSTGYVGLASPSGEREAGRRRSPAHQAGIHRVLSN